MGETGAFCGNGVEPMLGCWDESVRENEIVWETEDWSVSEEGYLAGEESGTWEEVWSVPTDLEGATPLTKG